MSDAPLAAAAPTSPEARILTPAEVVRTYHDRTKHGLKRYAAGPETLDWDLQPNPFREFAGAPRRALMFEAERLSTRFSDIYARGAVPPAPLTLQWVSTLLELSVGLSAWKEYGPDRWALRVNPSSGNLHPTEAYVRAEGVPGLADGLHHYVSRDHVLEQRWCAPEVAGQGPARLWIGLSSIQWREAWKYGERAFRYCQLDTGHAIGAFRYAAGALGWTVRLVEGLDSAAIAAQLGLDRDADFAGAEREDPELLLFIETQPGGADAPSSPPLPWGGEWTGAANLLDRHPLYRWPIIAEVSAASRGAAQGEDAGSPSMPPMAPEPEGRAADIILGRRSAQRFDARHHMGADIFFRLMDALQVRDTAPWDAWRYRPGLNPILFVHRVEGLESGLYALARTPGAADMLKAAMQPDFLWRKPDMAPRHLPLFQLAAGDLRGVARTVSCHQAIAGDGCFALAMLADFEGCVGADPWRYRQLHWEAGLLGQVLYLEAEAAGLRGTGIGCYFDDDLHRMLGLEGHRFQSLYHFTVGRPLPDARILTLPAYAGRSA